METFQKLEKSKNEKQDLFSRYNLTVFSIFIVVVLAAACVQQEKPVTEIKIRNHPQIYTFSYDIRESLKVPVVGKDEIQNLLSSSDEIDIVFNGTNRQDNAYFRVVLINIISKLQTYSVNEGKILEFNTFYFVDGIWYNSSNEETEMPRLGTAIWFKGPDTGAAETSVSADENIIYVQGTSYKNLTLAGDRLVLVAFGIDKI